jgi:nucleoside-diphosphate-sugar epimerase
VLVTGAGGFLGAATLAHLAQGGHEVHAVSTRSRPNTPEVAWHVADLLQAGAADELITLVRPELLLHLAWYSEHGRYWMSAENVRWVEATLRLVRSFVERGGQRAVLAGTCAEYAWDGQDKALSERETPLRPATLYGVSKNATRCVAEAFAEQAGIELAWGRIFFVYGPGEGDRRLVPSVVRSLLEARQASVTEGLQVRDFMHVNDVGAAFVALLDSDVHGAVNVGTGTGVTVRELVETIGSLTGRPELIALGAVPTRVDEPRSLVADVGRLRDEVGFRPRTSLRDGLEGTIAWWRARLGDVVPETA